MRAELERPGIELTAAQQRVAELADATIVATGPAACGKTAALAARALACRRGGGEPLIVCSHCSSQRVFNEALALLRRESDDSKPFRVATLAEHAAAWLSSGYLCASAAPRVAVGGRRAALYILSHAAKGLLDMTWPMFARADINLDLPHLSRPELFLEQAASLFSLLQRARVTPEEFEEGCAAGLAAFYGEQIERATSLLHDPIVRKRASGRGRRAMQACGETLVAQRKAERDLGAILAQLYRDYRTFAASAACRSAEDIIESAIRWLSADERAARSIASRIGAFIVDDAEDAEPGLIGIIQALRQHHHFSVVAAGSATARIDGFEGRRSALTSFTEAVRIELGPLSAPAARAVMRFTNESDEADWLAGQIQDLLRQGAQPERIALLTRTDRVAATYAQHLRTRGVPASKPSAMLEREDEIADLLALCAVVDNPLDTEHLLRVLSSPLAGMSDAGLLTLCREPAERLQLTLEVGLPDVPRASSSPKPDTLARNFENGSADSALPAPTRAMLAQLRSELARWRAHCGNLSPVERLLYVAGAAGFRDRWHAAPSNERERLSGDLARLSSAVGQAVMLWGVHDFSTIARLIDDGVVALRPAAPAAGAMVTDSIVSVKGQRFDHVFVAGVAHERFPRIYTSHAMAFSRTYGLIVRENVAGGPEQTAKFAWYYAKFGAKAMYIDEEQRALGYGLSRGRVSATASGFGTPPYWAREHDLLARLEGPAP